MRSGPVGRRVKTAVVALGALLAVCCLISVTVGAIHIPPSQILDDIGEHFRYGESIIWELRLPRVLLAAIVGAVLAAGGVSLQALLGNPLAEPYTVGVSSGCVLGASAAVAAGLEASLGGWAVTAASFASGLAGVWLVMWLSRNSGKLDVNSFLLAGIIAGSFYWAITTFLLIAMQQELSRVFVWLVGSFSTPYPWSYLWLVLQIGVVTLAGLWVFARDLNAYCLGEEPARHLGVEPEKLKLWVIGLVTLGTAACVSAAGVIGFAGLIVPHAMRKVFGNDTRVLLVSSALGGACLLVLADAAARGLMPPREIPIGVITSVVGAPLFLTVLMRQSK